MNNYFQLQTTPTKISFVVLTGGNKIVWIGLSDIETEGTFKFLDGTPFDFDDWHGGTFH